MPTEISDWNDLDNVRTDLTEDYFLSDDLNSASDGYSTHASATANGGSGWEPLSTFTGTLNGNGHDIEDYVIDRPEETEVGLFGTIGAGGFIENVTLNNVDVTGDFATSPIGRLESGAEIQDVHVQGGDVTGTNNNTGGFVSDGAGDVSDCSADVTVTSSAAGVGGFVGQPFDGATITNCHAHGNVTQTGSAVRSAGFAGQGDGLNVLIQECSATGAVDSNGGRAAGFIGELRGGATVSECYSTGNVLNTGSRAGGLIAYLREDASVNNSYATGETDSTSSSTGGIVGDMELGTVEKCYSTVVIVTDGQGLVGGSTVDSVVNNSFWDTEASQSGTSAEGTGKTTEEMQDIETYTNVSETSGLDEAWDMVRLSNFTGVETWTIDQETGQ